MTAPYRTLTNGTAVPLAGIPDHDNETFLQEVIDAVTGGGRVSAWFGVPADGGVRLYALLAFAATSQLGVLATMVEGSLPSITPVCPELHLFERELAEQFGIVAEWHPWFKPVRFRRSWRPGIDAWKRPVGDPILPCVTDYYRVEGEEVHEVAVGPVHAGIIEPGHFRFQCSGEEVFHLEIALGYQHRGIEERLVGGPHPATIHQMETAAGDTTIGHAQAHAMVMEALAGVTLSPRAEALRGIALELERLANHTGDLGALAGDVGYLPTASFCGRIRGDFLNMTAILCGSRFGRGLVRPGGVAFDLEPRHLEELFKRLAAARRDLENAVDLLWSTASVMARFEGTGRVGQETGRELGLVGPAARACGLCRDVRQDHPFGSYRTTPIQICTVESGDVHARALVRWQEAERSLTYIEEQLNLFPGGPCREPVARPAPESLAVALTEGWRGEICHVAVTDAAGRFSRYKIVDPSFHNWTGLAIALRGEQISDFPLCNKSFNLSYCGFDL